MSEPSGNSCQEKRKRFVSKLEFFPPGQASRRTARGWNDLQPLFRPSAPGLTEQQQPVVQLHAFEPTVAWYEFRRVEVASATEGANGKGLPEVFLKTVHLTLVF